MCVVEQDVLFYLSRLGLCVFFIEVLRLFTFSDLVSAFSHLFALLAGDRTDDA